VVLVLCMVLSLRWTNITGLSAAFNIADGTVISELHRQHRATEFKKFLITIDKTEPAALGIYLTCDNYGTHKTAASRAWLASTHASTCTSPPPAPPGSTRWNAGSGSYPTRCSAALSQSVQALERDFRTWITDWNTHPGHSCGPRPPKRSGNHSHDFVGEAVSQIVSSSYRLLRDLLTG
jgi:hypothetical protein